LNPVKSSYKESNNKTFDKQAELLFKKYDKDGNKVLDSNEKKLFLDELTEIYVKELLEWYENNVFLILHAIAHSGAIVWSLTRAIKYKRFLNVIPPRVSRAKRR